MISNSRANYEKKTHSSRSILGGHIYKAVYGSHSPTIWTHCTLLHNWIVCNSNIYKTQNT